MKYEEFYIPQYLDEKAKILFWTVDEFLIIFFSLWLSTQINKSLITLIITILLIHYFLKILRKFKKSGQTNLFICMLYWFYPSYVTKFKKSPKSSQRLYLG